MKRNDIPDGPHYAIMLIGKSSVHVPGDERSRTNPGHGYPAHTDTYDNIDYYAFSNNEREEWEEKVKKLFQQEQERSSYSKREVVAFHVDKMAHPKLNVDVTLD